MSENKKIDCQQLKNRMFHATQIGSREYYNYPRALNRMGKLASFSTDIWAPWAQNLFLPKSLARLKSRFNIDLEGFPVQSQNFFKQFISVSKKTDCRFSFWEKQGESFGRWASQNILKAGIDDRHGTFGFTNANLEIMQTAKKVGALAVHGQIDPGISWYETVLKEHDSWGGVENNIKPPTTTYLNRLREEWDIADFIIANSEHTKSSLISQKVNSQKILVVPLAYDHVNKNLPRRKPIKNRRLRVLFVGNVSLSKGFQYFGQAADKLKSEFEFVAAGNVLINQEFLGQKGWPVTYLNHINKSELEQEYLKADIFVFPTLSDGFGMVQLEAMSYGLPVIATENCAHVVEDNVSGYRIQSRSVESIIEKLELIKNDQNLYNYLSQNAIKRSKDFSLEKLNSLFE
ncbi:glycosyltransferase family 4 protein [Colwelliaceae bacterium 6441]